MRSTSSKTSDRFKNLRLLHHRASQLRQTLRYHRNRSIVSRHGFSSWKDHQTDLSKCTERVEVFPVKIKLDYKPKRVDYYALKQGKTAELMNFFHFDGSEMVLRHLVVTGVSFMPSLSLIHS